MKRTLDVRLVPAALAGWACAVLVVATPARVSLVVAACAASIAVVVLALVRSRHGAARATDGTGAVRGMVGLTATTLVVVAAVAASAAISSARAASALADDAARDGATVWLTAVVTSDPRPLRSSWGDGAQTRSAVTLRVEHVATGPDPAQRVGQNVRLPVTVVGGGAWAEVRYGATIATWGTLRPADGSRAERFEVVSAAQPELIAPEPALLRGAQRFRAGLATSVAGQPGDVAGLVRGMTVGDRAALPSDVEDAMRVTGLTHLTAVSGAHVAIVVGTLLVLLVVLRVPPRGRMLGLAVALVAFVILVRPDASVLRASVMGAVALLGIAAGRPARALPALATSVVVLLVIDPWLARSFGFVLSVVATGALVLGASPLAAALERRRVPSWLALLVAVPTVAQLACGPVVVLLAPSVPMYAILANLVVAPVVALATVSGVAAALLSVCWMPGAQLVVLPACWSADWIAWVATTLAGWPAATLPWPEGASGAFLLAAVTLAAWGAVLSVPAVRWWSRDALVRGRRWRAVVTSSRARRSLGTRVRDPWDS